MSDSLLYEFEIVIQRIYVDINLPCNLQVRWKKGKNQSSGKHFKIAQGIHFIDINDSIGVRAKCKSNNGRFLPQEARVQVLLFPLHTNEIKVAGQIQKFDLTQALLFNRRRENTQKQFQVSLSKSTKNARIIFTIYARYIQDCQNEESMADISFQGQSSFSQTTDMTFRPQSGNRHSSSCKQDFDLDVKSPLAPPRIEQAVENREERINSRQMRYDRGRQNKDSNRRQSEKTETRNQMAYNRPEQPLGFSFGPQNNPMDKDKQLNQLLRNFNDVNRQLIQKKQECERLELALKSSSKQDRGIDEKKLQLINELNASTVLADSLKKQRGQIANQLTTAKEQYRQLQVHYSKLKEENRELVGALNRNREEQGRQLSAMRREADLKNQQANELRAQLQKSLREKEEFKSELFKKQSEFLAIENHIEEIKIQYQNNSIPIIEELKRVNQDLGKQRAQLEKQLEIVSNQLVREKELRQDTQKRTAQAFEDFDKEKDRIKQLVGMFQQREKANKANLSAIEEEMHHFCMEKEEEANRLRKEISVQEQQAKQKEQQAIVREQELNRQSLQLDRYAKQLKSKEQQIVELNKMLAEQVRQRQQVEKHNQWSGKDRESSEIQISELKVKIKHLEEACENLEKDYEEKQRQANQKAQFLEKVRQYVAKIEADNQQKDIVIQERDQFIAKAKEFITNRERQLLSEIDQLKTNSFQFGATKTETDRLKNDLERLKIECDRLRNQYERLRNDYQKQKAQMNNLLSQASKRESFVAELVEESNSLQNRLDDAELALESSERRSGELQEYVGDMHERMQAMQQQMEELVRKTRSQEETLSQLVKYKLDMEIQLNICNFELNRLRRS